MEKYLDVLSWWQLPLTSLGPFFLSSVSSVLSVFMLLGIAYFVFKNLI